MASPIGKEGLNLNFKLRFNLLLLALVALLILQYFLSIPHVRHIHMSWMPFLALAICLLVLIRLIVNDSLKVVALIITGSVLLRLCCFISLPYLSDDFYRFFWDGSLLSNGISPFSATPVELMENEKVNTFLRNKVFEQLNSPNYYTIYPPFTQFIFYLSTSLFPESLLGAVNTMRAVLVLLDLGSILILYKLFRNFNLNSKNLVFYALNPIVVIEGIGNIHFEIALIFFLLLSLFFWSKYKNLKGDLSFAMAFLAKLWPLIYLPFLLKYMKLKQFLVSLFFLIVMGVIGFYLTAGREVENIVNSIDLYFRKFEFNGSLYLVAREIGEFIYGYNQINLIGPIMAVISFFAILYLAFKMKVRSIRDLSVAYLLALSIYFIFSPIVHPWYLLPLIPFGLLSGVYFPLVWSILSMLSYFAYSGDEVSLNLIFSLIIYIPTFLYAFYELRFSNSLSKN